MVNIDLNMNHIIKFEQDTKLGCEVVNFFNINFKVESGYIFEEFKIAFKTFGKLNEDS